MCKSKETMEDLIHAIQEARVYNLLHTMTLAFDDVEIMMEDENSDVVLLKNKYVHAMKDSLLQDIIARRLYVYHKMCYYNRLKGKIDVNEDVNKKKIKVYS